MIELVRTHCINNNQLLHLGEHVPRSRTNSLMVREIDDGLRRYEMDLWTLDPTQVVNKVLAHCTTSPIYNTIRLAQYRKKSSRR